MGKAPRLVDFTQIDTSKVVSTQEDIRQFNLQRHEMEMLSGVVYENLESRLCVAFQDVSPEAFWCRGHMPGYPIMPGVLICECAAQAASYLAAKFVNLPEGYIIGLGGLDSVKIRGSVFPGDRLFVCVHLSEVRHRMMLIDFEAVVNNEVVADGQIKGVMVSSTPVNRNSA